MSAPTTSANDSKSRVARRDAIMAWTCDVLACLYFAWLFGLHWRNAGLFAAMFDGMGVALPLLTRFVIGQSVWLFPALFLLFSGIVVGKEFVVHDKRFSVMLTFLVTIAGQFVAQAIVEAYYLPLRHMVEKLS